MPTKQFIGYVPVIHHGYLQMFDRIGPLDEVLVLGDSFAERFRIMRKDIRRLAPRDAVDCLRALNHAPHIRVVEANELPGCLWADVIVAPAEDVTIDLLGLTPLKDGQMVQWESSFLRWDQIRTEAHAGVTPDATVAVSDLPEHVVAETRAAQNHSADWWRRVGASVFRDGVVLAAAGNHHWLSDYGLYEDGDPRSNFSRGVNIDLSTALHAEQACIASCALEGMPLAGASILVTTFPCPGCARLIAAAGITACYYFEGYAMLEGDEILRQSGVKVVHVTT